MIETGGGRGHHGSVHPGVLDCMRPFKVSLPFGWPGESGADPRSQTIARSYPGYGRAPPETKDGHPSSQAYSSAIRLNAKIRPPSTYNPGSAGERTVGEVGGVCLAALPAVRIRLLPDLQELGNELAQARLPRLDIGQRSQNLDCSDADADRETAVDEP